MDLREGQIFGRWTVLDGNGRKVACRCICGTDRHVDRYSLLDGRSVSCGCHRSEKSAERGRAKLKHPVTFGDRFGRWLVLDASDRSAVKVRCDCGNEGAVPASNLVLGSSQSCGCYKREELSRSPHHIKHGLSDHPLFDAWSQMLKRCENPQNRQFKDYGGRGITVCERWHNPALFIGDIEGLLGARPDGLSLDRIDNDGDYEPGNVRWADRHTQRVNRRARNPGVSDAKARKVPAGP